MEAQRRPVTDLRCEPALHGTEPRRAGKHDHRGTRRQVFCRSGVGR
jgi:hypothetical protein